MSFMDIAELQKKASESLYSGEYSQAITFYEQCIEANPFELLNYWELGLANFLQGDELTAQSVWFSILLQGSSEENDARVAELVQILKKALVIQLEYNNIQLAEKICFQVLELTSDRAEIYYYMAICRRRTNEISEAISYLKKAIELNQNLAEAYSALGAFIRDSFSGEYEQAINYLQKAIELKPDYADPHYNMGLCFQDKGDLDEAIAYVQKAIELKPTLVEAYYGMAMCLRSKGEIDKAIGKLQEAILLQPGFSRAIRALEELAKFDQPGYAPQARRGYYFWDAILFKDNNLYRLFYLMGDSKASPYWSVGEVGAAISYDMEKWEYIGVVLQPEPAHEWQSGRMLAGSVYKENGIYYFFYSASPPKPLTLNEGIGIATSTDGISWQRSSNQIINLDTLDTEIYSYSIRSTMGGIKHFACRDPYIFKDTKNNDYYLFITTSCQGKNFTFRGCIGLAVSSNINGPYKVLQPVVYPLIPETEEGIFYEMERPQVIYREGKYHLFFSCATHLINSHWIKQVGREGITDSSLYWYVSENITGPFVPTSAKPIVKGSEKTGLYGTSFVEAPNGELIACGSNILSYTLEVSPRFPVRWENGCIEIIVN
jgi:tetratricopeptide (TPR) repeat protein